MCFARTLLVRFCAVAATRLALTPRCVASSLICAVSAGPRLVRSAQRQQALALDPTKEHAQRRDAEFCCGSLARERICCPISATKRRRNLPRGSSKSRIGNCNSDARICGAYFRVPVTFHQKRSHVYSPPCPCRLCACQRLDPVRLQNRRWWSSIHLIRLIIQDETSMAQYTFERHHWRFNLNKLRNVVTAPRMQQALSHRTTRPPGSEMDKLVHWHS